MNLRAYDASRREYERLAAAGQVVQEATPMMVEVATLEFVYHRAARAGTTGDVDAMVRHAAQVLAPKPAPEEGGS